MSIDLRVLEYFVATVDAGSANRAAERLHLTQPTLSRQLRQLQTTLGITLFERDGARLRTTTAGEQFLHQARDLLARSAAVERSARDIARGHLAQVRLAVPTTTLTDVLAPFLASLHTDDPIPAVRELDPLDAIAALRSGADLAIVTRPPDPSLASRPLAVLPLLAYVRADDEWGSAATVDVTDLVRRPLILLTPDLRPRTLLDREVDRLDLSYGETLECSHAQIAQALAAAGRGVAVVTDDPRFDLTPLAITAAGEPVSIRLYAAWDPAHHAAPTLADLADRLAAFCVERYGPSVAAP